MESGEPRWRPAPDKDTVTVEAAVIEVTADRRVRLRMENGKEENLFAPEEMSEFLRPGLQVVLYRGPYGELVGWYLPEQGVGEDLRS